MATMNLQNHPIHDSAWMCMIIHEYSWQSHPSHFPWYVHWVCSMAHMASSSCRKRHHTLRRMLQSNSQMPCASPCPCRWGWFQVVLLTRNGVIRHEKLENHGKSTLNGVLMGKLSINLEFSSKPCLTTRGQTIKHPPLLGNISYRS